MAMTSNRPYLIRAFFEWIVDNGCTPHLVVNALAEGVQVPQNHVTDDQIVLNIAPRAVVGFDIDNNRVSFSTRFGGLPTDIHVPIHAVMGIYAQENGQGMVFEPEEAPPLTPPDKPAPGGGSGGKPRLRVVE
ncbi:MAG: ClpXP protease specificity-enhancing factor [Gammaproteobacteria bacterium]|nr:MAG: ClpXP protease specificity-enhancing factor [Gammaproteobacteria bacterium]RLA50791.1 MAG: ClpXP protease specificity-enhancing factor [Gammaproteobacteria bacterium]